MTKSKRPCGSCSACCVLLAIDAPKLKKPQLTPCPHLAVPAGHGCGIYRHRPTVCREFSCVWRDGLIEEQFRPHEIGIIGEWYAVPGALGIALYVDPAWHYPNALEELIDSLPPLFREIEVVYIGQRRLKMTRPAPPPGGTDT
jgi:Fe-S-cluster containining protein